MEQKTTQKGLSGFQLKYIAMILMILDHIQYFFEFTGKIPVWFSMLGRLSAPLFLFCFIEGFIHTSNRKKYFLQIYSIAVVMGILQYLIITLGLERPDGFYPHNAMLSTFSVLLVILQGIDWCAKKKWLKGLLAIIVPIAFPFVVFFIGSLVPEIWPFANLLHFSFFPFHIWIMDGGTFFIVQGIIMYLLRNKRKWQAFGFCISTIVINIVMPFMFIPDLTVKMLFTEAYEWMGIFAVVMMLMYNKERGKGNKKLFYWFYPAHVYILCALSYLLYYIIY